MQTVVDLPRGAEIAGIQAVTTDGEMVTITSLTINHRFLKGQSVAPVCYLRCEGDKGNQTRSVLVVNANRGRFQVQNLDESEPAPFDMPPDEYQKLRARQKQQRLKQRSVLSPKGEDAEQDAEDTGDSLAVAATPRR